MVSIDNPVSLLIARTVSVKASEIELPSLHIWSTADE